MRKEFPGYYMPTEIDFQKIWSECIFVFDTNFLLDIYRYSEETVEHMFKIIEKLQDRIWIPYHVAIEYHSNLTNEIATQVKKYEDSIEILKKFKSLIEEKRSHPFLTTNLHHELSSFYEKFDKHLSERQKSTQDLILNNPNKERLADLLDGKIGKGFEENELIKLREEANKRYQTKIPPGYKDINKKNNEYGDFIIWKEILRESQSLKKPLVFITGDSKEDWYLSSMGLTIGPRPELINEFFNTCGERYHSYTTDKFIHYANEYLKLNVPKNIVIEVEALRVNLRENEDVMSDSGEIILFDNSKVDEYGNLNDSESEQDDFI